ncbi:ABC transporter substrate-binding protein [Paenibacillus kobensis]|uniref:ABC transporter substrate-binding protein n=1 Tax=Paenibacillus kobensis TaxID=59841 RepID=UPI000FD99690|nr:extracellular solute-binding protein [Paenibacillus kobensis]
MRTKWIMPALLSLLFLLQGCSTGEAPADGQLAYDHEDKGGADGIPSIRILTSYDHEEYIANEFRNVKHANLEWQRNVSGSVDEILAALDSNNPPDLIEFDYRLIQDLMNYDTFEDLSKPPYNALFSADVYFPKLNMDRFRSLDGTKLVFMPHILQAGVTFYRADLMKKYGFPDDPEELGAYMESPERWMTMAKELAAHGERIMQTPAEAYLAYTLSNGFFNADGTYARNNSGFITAMNLAKEAYASKLPLGASIWDALGQSALRSGELMMFISGEWADSRIQQWAPETADQWRKTRLPFNQYGIINGYICAIPKQSKNKEAAWSYIQYQLHREQGYLDSLELSKWYDKLTPIRLTPLDTAASSIWDKEVDWRYKTNDSARTSVSAIERVVTGQLADQLELLEPFHDTGTDSESGAEPESESE